MKIKQTKLICKVGLDKLMVLLRSHKFAVGNNDKVIINTS